MCIFSPWLPESQGLNLKLWWPAVVTSGLHINCTPLCSQRCTFICILLSSFPFPQYDYSLYGMREEIVQRIGEQQTKYRFSHLFFQLLDKIRFPSVSAPSEHMLCYPNLGSGKGWRRGCRSWVASDWIKASTSLQNSSPNEVAQGKDSANRLSDIH